MQHDIMPRGISCRRRTMPGQCRASGGPKVYLWVELLVRLCRMVEGHARVAHVRLPCHTTHKDQPLACRPDRCWHCALLLLLCALATGWPDRPRRSQHCSLERVQDATLNKRTEHCGNSGNAHEEHTLVSGVRLGIEHYPLRTAAALCSVNGTGPQLPIATD